MRRDYAYCQSKDIFILNGREVSYEKLKNVSSNLFVSKSHPRFIKKKLGKILRSDLSVYFFSHVNELFFKAHYHTFNKIA